MSEDRSEAETAAQHHGTSGDVIAAGLTGRFG